MLALLVGQLPGARPESPECILGSLYVRLAAALEERSCHRGWYTQTVYAAVSAELSNYERCVALLARQSSEHCTLLAALFPYLDLLPECVHVLQLCSSVRGSALLTVLAERRANASAHCACFYAEVLGRLTAVFFQQLRLWLLYGTLHDPLDEFLLQEHCDSGEVSVRLSHLPPQLNAEDAALILEIGQNNALLRAHFHIDPHTDALHDSCTPQVLASTHSILLDPAAVPTTSGAAPSDQTPAPTTTSEAAHAPTTTPLVRNSASSEYMQTWRRLDHLLSAYVSAESQRSARGLLQRDHLRVMLFEVRDLLEVHLLRLISGMDGFADTIYLLRQLFLMQNGYGHTEFLCSSAVRKAELNSEPQSLDRRSLHALSESFSAHVLSSRLRRSTPVSRIRLGFDDGLPESEWCWERLRLQVQIQWPMQLLLTDGVVSQYQRVYRFLSSLKRCEIRLGELWSSLRMELRASAEQSHRGGDTSAAAPQDSADRCPWSTLTHRARLLCWQLLTFSRELTAYCLRDVIEAHSTRLHADLIALQRSPAERSHFRAAFEVHRRFAERVVHACFLHIPPVARLLHSLFSVIDRLCAWALAIQTASVVRLRLLDDPERSLATLTQDASKYLGLLFDILALKLDSSRERSHTHLVRSLERVVSSLRKHRTEA